MIGYLYIALDILARFFSLWSGPPYRLSPLDGSIIALPTPEQLAFQDREIGVIIHFEIATYLDELYDGCNGNPHLVPDIHTFRPRGFNVTNWMDSIASVGGKTATLVVKHNCGFTTWPTRVTFEDATGKRVGYDYSIDKSPVADLDVAAEFTAAAEGIGHGFYYSLNYNNYLNYYDFQVGNETGKGQVDVTKETYDDIVLKQLEELWSSYGSLTEIWFDGGFSKSQLGPVRKLLEKYQPDAVVFNGCDTDGICSTKHPIRWIGTEGGQAPEENWSTGLTNDGGDPGSKFFAPAECDTATYRDGRWFYGAHDKPRSFSELVKIYHETVGRNCFLELGLSPNRHGLIPQDHAEAYEQLGSFIQGCYGNPLVPSHSSQHAAHLRYDPPVRANRVVLMEDQTNGQVIREYTVTGRDTAGAWRTLSQGTSVGHKKIDIFANDVVVTEIVVNTKHVDTPKWRSISLHHCERV